MPTGDEVVLCCTSKDYSRALPQDIVRGLSAFKSSPFSEMGVYMYSARSSYHIWLLPTPRVSMTFVHLEKGKEQRLKKHLF
jgi:hypothetical protein